jgi:ketosteroid isomerase-like protein
MSQQNVQVVHEAIRCFSASDLEGLLELYHQDAVVTAPEGWPEGGDFDGRDAIAAQMGRLMEDWRQHTLRAESIEAEGDWVVARLHWDVRGAESGVPMQMDVSAAYRLRQGKLAETVFTWDHGDARKAAGLSAS